jgi:hypothetical protein
MNHTIVRVFDSNEQAQRARSSLLSAGFGADAITLSVTSDEAGAVAGNFYVGNPPSDAGDDSYERTYANPRLLSQCILTVDTGDDDAAVARATNILDQLGARAADPAAGGER